MAYIPSECTLEQYNKAVYSEDARHKLYLKIGDTVIEEPDNFCESMTLKNLLLDDGSKNFHLDNFVSKTIELILHNYIIEDLTQEIDIKLGTYINPTIGYVYVPIGVYKVQDNPTTNKNKTTYKLRDRSVNFDFGYNAQEIIEKSSKTDEKGNKYVTKLEIVDDICSKAGVIYVGDRNFAGYDDKIGIYDNSVTGRIYISYIFEQAGRIATINREGNLTSVLINNNLNVQELPLDLIESYTIKKSYKISKTIYESGAIYFENGTETDDMLFINGSNPYIANQNELDRVARLINGFEIDSYSISKIIGNPAIDSYDLIQLNTGNNIYKTLAQNTLKYNGKLIQSFETNIEYEARQTNSTKNGEMTFRKYVKSEIDNINATIKTTVEETTAQIKGLEESIDLFSVDLSQYTLTIPTNSNRYPLETKTYTVNYYGYYKGKQVKPSVSVSGNKVGITTSTTTKNVGFAVDTNTPINGLSNNFTLTFTYNSPDGVYTLTKVITIGLSIQGKDGINGVDGKDGTSVNILGSYNSLEELKQAHPTGNVGDAYIVQGDMYVWSVEDNTWIDVGDIQGPPGINGKDGENGKSSYQIWLEQGNTGSEQDYLNSLKGEDGEDGYTPIKGKDYFDGKDGVDGYTPIKGIDYFDGTNGKDGTPAYFYVRYSANANGNPMTTAPTSTTKYMGVASTTSSTAPTSYSAYTWTLIKGEDGADGVGTPGKDGENGLTPYLHIKYSEDGITFTPADDEYALGEKPSAWFGQYVDYSEADSNDFDDYEWYKFTEDIDPKLEELQDGINDANESINNTNLEVVQLKTDVTQDRESFRVSVEQLTQTIDTNNANVQNNLDNINNTLANGVETLKNTLVTININGISVATNVSKISTLITNNTFAITSSGTNLAYFGYDEENGTSKAEMDNLTIHNYFIAGYHRTEKFEINGEKRSGVFYVGGDE